MDGHCTQRQVKDCQQKSDYHQSPLSTLCFHLLQALERVVAVTMHCRAIEIVKQGSAKDHKYDQKHQGLDYNRSEIQSKYVGTVRS